MITEKRTLPVGIEHDGKVHRELEIRPRLVKDLIAASGKSLVAQDKNNYEVCCLAQQITKLGDIAPQEITGELLLEMFADDFDVLAEAAEKARQRAASFRSESVVAQKDNTGSAEDGV